MRKLITLFLFVTSVITLACIPYRRTVRLKVGVRPVQFVSSSTKEAISEVLVIPQYVFIHTASTPLSKKDRSTYNEFVSVPFTYRDRIAFKPMESKTKGVVWVPGCAFAGKEILMKGALVLAPGYQPRWFSTSAFEGARIDLMLNAISEKESSEAMKTLSDQIEKGVLQMPEECSRYYLSPCILEVHFNRNELENVRSFLKKTVK